MSDNIPFDIQREIIKKVPDVKSLVRFRSVSKPWKSFIDSSEFIAGYGARYTQPHRLLLRYRDIVDPSYELKYLSILDDVSFPQHQQDFVPNVTDLVEQLEHSKVIGSSCGLWCLSGYNSSETEMVVIWNPSIRKSVGIVVPCELNKTSEKYNHFGFGVCPKTYDPTIVGISFRLLYIGLFFDDDIKNLVLSFDLITHEFKEVNLPVSMENKFLIDDISISKLNESLVVSAYTAEVNDGLVYGVWMMGEEGGVMTSFTKLFTINTLDSLIRTLLEFRKSGEPILETGTEDELFAALDVYQPCSEHTDDLGIPAADGSFFICPYTETLLLIDHSDGCIISNDCQWRKLWRVLDDEFWKLTKDLWS